jgi:hypothetical protein
MTKAELINLKSEIKSLGWLLIVFGIIHILASEYLSFFWGFLLIGFGIYSIFSQKVVVLLIFGILILIAGVSNLFSSVVMFYLGEELNLDYFWIIFGGLQIWWGIVEIKKYGEIKKKFKVRRRKK